jgi:phosphoribosylformylglycinamidine synthase
MALDYNGKEGIATSIGHSPVAALLDPAGSRTTAIAEALSKYCLGPIKGGLTEFHYHANWMWACKKRRGCSFVRCRRKLFEFCNRIGINIPTGKDSLS